MSTPGSIPFRKNSIRFAQAATSMPTPQISFLPNLRTILGVMNMKISIGQ